MVHRVRMSKSQTKTMLITSFEIKGIVRFGVIPQGQTAELIIWKYWNGWMKLCVEKGLNFCPSIDPTPWQCSSSEGAVSKAVPGQRIDYSYGTLTLFHWFGSNFRLFSEIKCFLKGRRFQDIEDTALKTFSQQESQKCFEQWQHRWGKCIATEGGVLQRRLLVSCKYAASFRELHSHTSSLRVFVGGRCMR